MSVGSSPYSPRKTSWPSDVTLLKRLRTVEVATRDDLAQWMLIFSPDSALRTRVRHVARGLARLSNDGLVTDRPLWTDERIREYMCTKHGNVFFDEESYSSDTRSGTDGV